MDDLAPVMVSRNDIENEQSSHQSVLYTDANTMCLMPIPYVASIHRYRYHLNRLCNEPMFAVQWVIDMDPFTKFFHLFRQRCRQR